MRRILFVVCLAATLAGCLTASTRAPADDATRAKHFLNATDCDKPLLGERVRAREIDAATDPTNPDHLAVGLIVSMPSERANPPNDWPFWDALARSEDGGKTWKYVTLAGWQGDAGGATAPWFPSVFLSDPIVMFLHDGTLIESILAVQTSSVTMFMSRYAAGSLTPESTSVVVRSSLSTVGNAHTLPIGPAFTIYNDKQQMFEDPATGDIYVTWFWRTDFVGTQRAQPMISKSADGGRTWTAPIPLYKNGHFDDPNGGFHVGSWPFVTLDGLVHAIWWDDHSKKVYQVDSLDKAKTFGEPHAIADAPTSFAQPGGVIQLGIPSIDIDRSLGPYRGSVYVTWEDRRNKDRDVFAIHSRDNATSWSAPVRVNSDEVGNGKDQFMPQLVVQPTGAVGIVFYDRRDDPSNTAFLTYIARSLDGGQTFANYPIATKPSVIANIENGQNEPDPLGRTRLGDYIGLTYNKAGLVAVWQDGREGTSAKPYSDARFCAAPTA
jgi:hypothetical protein